MVTFQGESSGHLELRIEGELGDLQRGTERRYPRFENSRCSGTQGECCRHLIFLRESGSVSESSDPIFLENKIAVKENHCRRILWFQPRGSCPAVKGKVKPENSSSSGYPVMENTSGEG